MRVWQRVDHRTVFCGLCGKHLKAGDPVLAITLPQLKRPRFRCESCVGDAPPDLPPLETRAETVVRPMVKASDLAADWKLRQAGDRDPGEDDT